MTDQTPAGGSNDAPALADLTREELLELLDAQVEGGIRLQFSGKANARTIARKVRPRVLREVKKYGAGPEEDRARNLLVEGDCLQAMATLYSQRGQVDLIIADPPYNTGNDFRYNDRWETDPNDPGIGDLVPKEDGSRHTKWMRFMYPRLQLMKQMLKPNGVLAICIDYRELFHLGQMLDELFREENRLGVINWQKSYTTRGDSGHVAATTEYVLIYANNAERTTTRLLPRSDEATARYMTPDGDSRPWKSGHSGGPSPETHKTMVYGIQHPVTGEIIYPNERNSWRFRRDEMQRLLEEWGTPYKSVSLDDGLDQPGLVLAGSVTAARKAAQARMAQGSWPRLFFGKNGQGRPQVKFYLDSIKDGVVPATYWADEDYDDPLMIDSVSWDHEQSGHSQAGVQELTALVGKGHGFDTVKPMKLITKIITIWCPPDGLVVDPFAGSGTTGHAVLSLNQETGATRRFTLMEQGRPENGDPYARDLTSKRLTAAVTGKWASGQTTPLGSGYRFAVLAKKVDAPTLLMMERTEMTDTVIASHFDATKRRGVGLCPIPDPGKYRYLVAKNTDEEGFFLVWDGVGGNTDFNEDVYEDCAAEAVAGGLKPRYHVYARLYLFQTSNVVFYQIPDRILRDFGLDLRGEPFSED